MLGQGRRRLMIVLLVVLAMVAAACTTDADLGTTTTTRDPGTTDTTDTTDTTEGDDPAAPETVELVRVSGPGPVTSLDPSLAATAPEAAAIELSAGKIFRFDLEGIPQLDLAESFELSEDGRTVRVVLVEDAVYSDGTPVAADDFRFAWERATESRAAADVANIEDIEVVDERTADIQLVVPDGDLPTLLARHYLSIHPKEQIESNPDYFAEPVSAGPYTVESWTPDNATFVSNDAYLGGPMMIETIEIVNVPDVQSRVLQLSSGDLDVAFGLPFEIAPALPSEVRQTIDQVAGLMWIWINTGVEGLSDLSVRQAISLALDREAISQNAFFGFEPPATSHLHSCGDLCEPNLLLNAGERDLEAARSLMADAGYADGDLSVTIMTDANRGGFGEAAVIIAENLREIGIEAEVQEVDAPTLASSRTEGTYDMSLFVGLATPQTILARLLTSDGIYAQQTFYDPGPEAEALVEEAAAEIDPVRRQELFSEIQTLMNEHMHMVPVLERAQLTGWRIDEDLATMIPFQQIIRVATVAEMGEG